MFFSGYIVKRTDDNVKFRAGFLMFLFASAIIAQILPNAATPYLDGFGRFVEYFRGGDWLSILWLSFAVVTFEVGISGTRIWEAKVAVTALTAVCILSTAYVFWTFLQA